MDTGERGRRPVMARCATSGGALRLLVLCAALGAAAVAHAGAVNGTWRLDAAASENLEDVADALNDRLNEKERDKPQEFERRSSSGGNRYQAQVDAVERMIKEDNRSRAWGGPPEVREMLNAQTLKIYQQKKVVILYDGQRKRLLRINPAGRAFSYSGTETTDDELGRSLTYLDDEALVVETQVYDGGNLVERFEVVDGGARLRMTARQRERSAGPWLELTREFTRED
jgi:hypothetical protein